MFSNQDTAFSPEKRDELHLRGLLPPAQQSMDLQIERALAQIREKKTDLGRYVALTALRQTNVRLFYALVMAHGEETLPMIYTPTVGEACQKFSRIFRQPEGLTITIEDKGSVKDVISNWPVPAGAPRIAVITDGSRILGLGDLGYGGLGISIGKLSLYVAAGGIHPRATLPIVVDVGTNNQELLDDPLYLGLRRKRASDDEVYALMDEVMEALQTAYPNLIIQFEDWASERAFGLLERFQNTARCFNDDIQGTGCVILGGFVNAARLGSQASGKPLHDQRILFFGAGSAGVGVAKQLMAFFTRQGLTVEEARRKIWLVDSKGLITKDRGDKLADHKVYFAREDNEGKQYKSLDDVVDYVKPTALIGLSTVPKTFTPEVLQKMHKLNKAPIIMPLSNPSSLSECDFHTALEATEGSCIFASGSPFPEEDYNGKHYIPGQGNNLYVFPAIGLAGALCKAGNISDAAITEAAVALADSLNDAEKKEGRVYPSLKRIREISASVATRVIQQMNKEGAARDGGYTGSMEPEELHEWVKGEMWVPSYEKLVA
ncbi:related to nadp-dependent malic enzyme [Ceraceosorus bombacis]|uniref:Malic enzyme n=1 Tax=Ceraceosorus bombacis TaxID=401625 RepID=A0A0P1BL65_9BASI|nr:related to nadp-dependent malic enzyme [Ceraceosorus bombacis]